MDMSEALLIWATQKRRRDRGEPIEPERLVPALRFMYAWVLERGETIDTNLPPGLAVGTSGMYDVEEATEEEILKLAEDMYQESRASDDL